MAETQVKTKKRAAGDGEVYAVPGKSTPFVRKCLGTNKLENLLIVLIQRIVSLGLIYRAAFAVSFFPTLPGKLAGSDYV
jgi:hypothetical protein